ncbi:MAG: copper oxidase, partial [Acidimicrobiia bacterium]
MPVVVLLAALVGAPVALASKASGTSHPSAVPTADLPLPVTDSPITFTLSDQPGSWFDTGLSAVEGVLHTRSLGVTVAGTPTKVSFKVSQQMTDATHTVSSVVWPVGAEGFPFTQQGSFSGTESVEITKAGLYAFQCRVHPYMLGAVVADDPATVGADLGKELNWIDGTVMPSAADEVMRIVRSFFEVTNPDNWQVYAADHPTTWDPSYPAAPVLTYDANGKEVLIPNLDAHFQERFNEPETLMPPVKPTEPGVGEAWVDTQFEKSAGKDKPGAMTAFDTETWDLTKKFFLPSVNLNNPHNMWSDRDQKLIYQTHWFSNKLSTVDRETGAVLRTIEVGPSPSHVVTRSNSDNLIIPNNGGNRIVEVAPGGTRIVKSYLTQAPGKNPAFPHAHWVSYDGKHVVTPNSNETTAAIFDLDMPSLIKPESGKFPVATSMTNDGKRAYVANLLDHTISCISIAEAACPTPSGGKETTNRIDLRQNYDKITGKVTGPFALSPIQLPISPDDKYMLVVGTFSSNVL